MILVLNGISYIISRQRRRMTWSSVIWTLATLLVELKFLLLTELLQYFRKIRSMTHAVKSKSAKASDRAKKAEGLSDYCNKLLLEEHAEGYKYLAYRPDECTFLIKRDYEKFDSDYSDDIDAAHTESEQLFDSMDKWIETQSTRAGKKALQGKKDELFGGGKPSMEPFKKLLCSEIRRVVPRFERTAVVEVRVIPTPM
mmetsp:Transcript_10827/g.13833  ORF Transcript_10827/g.13833 Transcript_10827/m.13833 type:complete len:198 (+) Transcript_10827:657-1250(+)